MLITKGLMQGKQLRNTAMNVHLSNLQTNGGTRCLRRVNISCLDGGEHPRHGKHILIGHLAIVCGLIQYESVKGTTHQDSGIITLAEMTHGNGKVLQIYTCQKF